MIWAALALAQSQTQEENRVWEALYDGRLVTALEGTPIVAVQYYEEILAGLPEDSQARGEVLYWLGHARFLSGDLERSAAALKEARSWPDQREQADRLLARIDLERQEVAGLPLKWDFSTGQTGFVRVSDHGAVGIARVDGDPALSWTLPVLMGEIERISMGLMADTEARLLTFRARASRFPANLQVVVQGAEGGRFAAPLQVIPVDTWVNIRISLENMRSLDAAGRTSLRSIRLVELQDLTGYLSSDRGENTLYVDDFTIL